MNVISVPINSLVSPEKNVRIHSDKQINEFVRSIKKFGQIRPVVIDENNVVLAGNGLVEALKRAEIETAFVYKIDNLSENDKKKLMIADNKIFSLGIDNLDTLNSFLEDLQDDLDIPGFDEDILASMVESSAEVTERISNYGVLDEEEINAIRENADKKNTAIESPKPITTPITSVPPEKGCPTETVSTEVEPEGDFVICPKCGEKIWL
ncbi:MAG: ParB N-terminal domain-containing protein [Clostridia bacterium]|nr:ParB N-terminal domain-containing protein [Clostridia bacterium]